MAKMTPHELKQGLEQFYGTEDWHRMRPGVLLTDGARFLAEQAGAFWLMDVIWSYQTFLRQVPFQVWHLKRQGEGCVVWVEDGNYNKLKSQDIGYTDFPLDEIELFASRENGEVIILLPSEY